MVNNIVEVNKINNSNEILKYFQSQNTKVNKGDGYGNKKEGIIMQKIPNRCNEQYLIKFTNENKDLISKVNDTFGRKKSFIYHIYVNHLMTSNQSINDKNNILQLSFTRRIRSKFVTIIYYDCKKRK